VSGSSDTYKFNKGEPTENIIASTNLINVVAGTFTTDSTVDGVRILENDQVNNSHVMWNSATGFIITCSAGAYITVSAEYKTDCTIRMRFRDNPYDTQFDIDGGNINTISETSVDINTIGEWKRHSLTAQTSTANPDLWWYLADYRPNNEFGRVEVRNWQIEVKPHATPFTTGTRSVSGSLIDLTRTTDIDLSNVSFDSNAQMTFDGTDDQIIISDIGANLNNFGVTFEIVWKQNNIHTSSTFGEIISPIQLGIRDLGVGPTMYFQLRTSVVQLRWQRAANDATISPSTPQESGVYGVYVGILTPTGVSLYKNGILIGTTSHSKTFLSWYDNTIKIGNNAYNTYFDGDIPIAKVYNRALTAQEILQNYNAVKERFSL